MLVMALFLVSLGVSKTFKALVVTFGNFQFASYVYIFFFLLNQLLHGTCSAALAVKGMAKKKKKRFGRV